MRNRAITVCGAGAAGTAIAADLALKGHAVTLYELPAFADAIEDIRSRGGIQLTEDSASTSRKTGFASLESTTTDAAEAVHGAEALMITPPALHHRAFVESLFPHLEPGQFVLFNTGYWGSLRFADDLRAAGRFDDVTLCETNIMPYLSKRMDSTATKIYNAKRVMTLAAFPGERTGDATELFRDAYEEYKSVPNVMWTNLSSGGNWCIHVQLTLPIMGYVFDRFRGCKFYTEATEQFSRLSAAFDRERSPLVDRFGCGPVETGPQWAKNAYGYEGKDLADAFRKSPHADRFSPVAALDRVLDEDIAYSFVPMTRLARAIGLEMPTTEGMVHVTGAMLEKDYWEMGLSLDDLGLVGLDAPTMMKFVDTGRT